MPALSHTGTKFPPRVPASQAVCRVTAIIHERYPHRLTIRGLAAELGRDPSSLTSIFRNATGQTLHGYLTAVRMRRATELVRDGFKIDAVMLLVGYRSRKNFYLQFRRHTGCTPGEYRVQ